MARIKNSACRLGEEKISNRFFFGKTARALVNLYARIFSRRRKERGTNDERAYVTGTIC